MSNVAKIWDRWARKYADQPIKDKPSYQRKLDITKSYLDKDMKVLEIGCGTAMTAIHHSPKVSAIDALDCSGKMLDISMTNITQAGVKNIKLHQADINKVELKYNNYDIVLALSILHLVDDYEEIIEKIYSAMATNGIFVSSTICLGDSPHWYTPLLTPLSFLNIAPKVTPLRRKELVNSLKKTGFEVEIEWNQGPKKAIFVVARKV